MKKHASEHHHRLPTPVKKFVRRFSDITHGYTEFREEHMRGRFRARPFSVDHTAKVLLKVEATHPQQC